MTAETETPDPTDLMSAVEIAALLGIQPGTVHSYHARRQMPEPYVTLGCGPIWLRSTIEHWHRFERPHAKHPPSD